MKHRLSLSISCLLLLGYVVSAQPAPSKALDVPMDRQIRTVLLRFGVKAKEEATWEGTYRVTGGEVIASEGWRFTGNDYATVSDFSFGLRRFYPRHAAGDDRDPYGQIGSGREGRHGFQ